MCADVLQVQGSNQPAVDFDARPRCPNDAAEAWHCHAAQEHHEGQRRDCAKAAAVRQSSGCQHVLCSQPLHQHTRRSHRIVHPVADDLSLVPLRRKDPAHPGRRPLEPDGVQASSFRTLLSQTVTWVFSSLQAHRDGRVARPVHLPHHGDHGRQARLHDLVAPLQLAPHPDLRAREVHRSRSGPPG